MASQTSTRVATLIERDLSLLTGDELIRKYSRTTKRQAFEQITGKPLAEMACHNPFWHYLKAVWFSNPDGAAMLSGPHKELADAYLALALGEMDKYDGFFNKYPRRSLKSSFLVAFTDWVPKRHKHVDKMDVLILYSHNSDQQSKARTGMVKRKNQRNDYIRVHFPGFVIPDGEWGTSEEWDWPCRDPNNETSERSITAMSANSKKAGRGYHYRLLDDWEDEDSRFSEQIRDQLMANYDQQRQLCAAPFSREVICDTPYHIHGLTQMLTDGKSRYFIVSKPALTDEDKINFPGIPKLSLDGLAKERANEISRTGNDAFWYMQYQLEPRLTGLQAMEWSWFLPMSISEWRIKWNPLPHFRCVFVDSAWKGSERQTRGDATSIQVVDLYRIGEVTHRIILDHVWSNELVSDEGAIEICRLMSKWGTTYYCIEQTSEKTFNGVMRVIARSRKPPIMPISIDLKGWSKKAKETRISAVAGAARLGTVHYLDGLPHLDKMMREADDYPQVRRSPNCLDCLANSFADTVINGWIPAAPVATFEPQTNEASYVPLTRYTNLPGYFAH